MSHLTYSYSQQPPNQYIVVSSAALTREEKRMAKDPLMADKIKARKAGMTASRHRKDGRLPGGKSPPSIPQRNSMVSLTKASGLLSQERSTPPTQILLDHRLVQE